MKVKRKLFCVLVAFFLLPYLAFGQSQAQSNLSNLEDYVISIENESLKQKERIESLEQELNSANQSVENLNVQLKEMSALQERQSNLSKKSELRCTVLSWSLGISVGINIIAIGTIYFLVNK